MAIRGFGGARRARHARFSERFRPGRELPGPRLRRLRERMRGSDCCVCIIRGGRGRQRPVVFCAVVVLCRWPGAGLLGALRAALGRINIQFLPIPGNSTVRLCFSAFARFPGLQMIYSVKSDSQLRRWINVRI